MPPIQQLNETVPSVIRLGPGTAAVVLGVHLIFVGLQSLFNVWVALTPSQDMQWKPSPSRA